MGANMNENNQKHIVNVKIELELKVENKKYSYEEVREIIGKNMDDVERFKLVNAIKNF
ncbi:hypothetical protein [Ureibacillus aquaedulcis]|uniref:Uncharacterized protein n=1 Tax=Ureibacillus aquaedulcis TaxID=3058421 RepID=A0ABT8GPK8_9BACL|nr:hypothetical protein [Ureibacillus sp. BA0131]MDN4493356.1 hypothetical protein [Ureibacillus sp. BA0131]